jgi:hypothetical protein
LAKGRSNGRLPRVENWFERVKERPTVQARAFIDWMPSDLSEEMGSNGEKSVPPQIKAIIEQ